MLKSLLVCLFLNITITVFSQVPGVKLIRPKLVVGIVVDQMRWDFLYRYYDRYTVTGGFKRMLNQGFSCENTFIPYAPTVTACGHATIFTGSVPAIHGITGNAWWDRQQMRLVYCTEDKTVKGIGTPAGAAGEMSPRNMLSTTIGDELRLSTNFRSKVIGISFKDRAAILPAGHSANGAYWYDAVKGNFITSDYYMNELPQWVNTFNQKKWPDLLYKENWNTLYPIATYTQSSADVKAYETMVLGADKKGFPYDLTGFIGKNYGAIGSTPHGNTLTLEMTKAAIDGEQLGKHGVTDMLTVSFSAPDYVGHSFGPNSIEIEDTYLRLDKTLGDLLNFLDTKIGKGQYLIFLTADHGVAQVPAFLNENKIPAGVISDDTWMNTMNSRLNALFGKDRLIVSMINYQVHLNHQVIDSAKLDIGRIKQYIVGYLESQKGIAEAFDIDHIMDIALNSKVRDRFANGFFPRRNGDVQYMLEPHWIDGGSTGTTHGTWNPYDAHIPLLFYGWHIPPGKTNREVYMTDIASTVAALLRIQMPSGSIGNVIGEISK